MSERIFERLNDASGVWFDGTLVERRQTPFQLLEVYDTPELGRIFRLDGFNMTSERDEFFYHENLVHPAAVAHPRPRRALVIGGGDGGSSEELLRHATIERVHMAELDPDVIEISKRAVRPGPRRRLRRPAPRGDGGRRPRATCARPPCATTSSRWTSPTPWAPPWSSTRPPRSRSPGGRSAEGGALVLHMGSPFSHPDRVRQTLASLRAVFRVVAPYFVHIPLYGSIWGFACASDSLDPRAVEPAEIDRRLAARGVGDLQYYNGEVHRAVFALPNYVRALVA